MWPTASVTSGCATPSAVSALFGDRVAQLVALHVEAKRYLVSADAAYRARLSPDSVRTLALQGGDMTAEAFAAFEAEAHWRDRLRLREADEAAKNSGPDGPGTGRLAADPTGPRPGQTRRCGGLGLGVARRAPRRPTLDRPGRRSPRRESVPGAAG